jgi:hypothetical protein
VTQLMRVQLLLEYIVPANRVGDAVDAIDDDLKQGAAIREYITVVEADDADPGDVPAFLQNEEEEDAPLLD